MTDNLDINRRRAAYRAHHRGTKEMDWLLGRFVDEAAAQMDDGELALFERFMELPDPMLHKWIMEPGQTVDEDFAILVDRIREFHRL